ncbi:hypothetical protein Aperf_G00000072246 [Anoplocephala perfoliata]
MFSARAKADSSTCSVTPIRNTIVSEANSANDVVSAPTIHVHHFHHHSCLHHPELLCQNFQPTAPVDPHSEDQYAVILNPNYPSRQVAHPAQANKQSAFSYTASRKPISTATIRHPIPASLALPRRYFHSPDPTPRLNSSSIPSADCTSFASPISSPRLLAWNQQQHQQQNQCLGVPIDGTGCCLINGNDLHGPPSCPFSQVIAGDPLVQNIAATRAVSANLSDSQYRYRLVPPGSTNHHPSLLEQQRRYHDLAFYGIANNVTNGQLPYLSPTNCGSRSGVEDSNAQHRRSKSQPPHRLQQQQQVMRPDSKCTTSTPVSKGNQHRNNRQTRPTESASNSHHRRGHLPHWLFPHDHQSKHSRSPPSSCLPPPPPPRSTAVRSKPLTRSVEVQTEPAISPPCCYNDFDSKLFERENVTRCWCSAGQGQPIMLHHYHVHHYYHCEDQQPASDSTNSVEPAVVSEPASFRTSSPLIKLSATWPPNMAVTSEEEEETTNRTGENPQEERETSPSSEEITNRDPPAHVSNALAAVESPQEEITTKGDTQEDQRRIFLQNINQLKRTGWYWGPLTIEEAELLLKDRPNGSFLVRDSGHELYILSVSFRAENRTYHTRIEHMGGKFGFAVQGDSETSSSIAQFIDHVIAESERGRTRFFLRQSALTTSSSNDLNGERTTNQLENEGHVEARLLYPVSRFLVVHSLAHLCRFEILLKVRKDQIDQLPLPDRLKKYLHERQYYTEFTQAYLESMGEAQNDSETASSS